MLTPFRRMVEDLSIGRAEGLARARLPKSGSEFAGGTPARLPGAARGRLRLEVAGGEVLAHLLMSGLNEPGIVEDLLDLGRRGVTADVLFLNYVLKMRPIADAVADVLEDLPLPLVVVRAAKELVPEASFLFVHDPSSTLADNAGLPFPKCIQSTTHHTGRTRNPPLPGGQSVQRLSRYAVYRPLVHGNGA